MRLMTPPILKEYLASFSVLTRPVAFIIFGNPNAATEEVFTGITSASSNGLCAFFSSLQENKTNIVAARLSNCILFITVFFVCLLNDETCIGTFYFSCFNPCVKQGNI